MNPKDSEKIQSQPPLEDEAPRFSEPATSAGGLPAVLSSFKQTLMQMTPLRGTQAWLRINQKNGFDCPGCAWPDPDDKRSLVEFCENGVKAIAEEATRRTLGPEYFQKHSLSEISEHSDFEMGKLGRLTDPLFKPSGSNRYQAIDWKQAFELIADELSKISPDEATFYTSGRTSNEAAFLYQLMVRAYGTNNLPDCSNMCHESSGLALTESLGVGKGSVTLEDFDHADCILILGQNPGTNHPRMLTTLQQAVRRGCKIISVNPLAEAGLTGFKHPQEILGLMGRTTPIASLHLPVKINGDVALLKGVMKCLIAMEEKAPGQVLNWQFIRTRTSGFEALIEDLKITSWDSVLRESGIPRAQIEEMAVLIAGSKNLIACWAMGLTQHKNAVANIQQVVNLLLLGGHIGRPGAGTCPVRGHSNVQGDRTMGIFEKMPPEFLSALGSEFGFTPPFEHGKDVVDSIRAMHQGHIKIFIGMGGNFLSASPDTEFVATALQKCRLTVNVATKLNRGHLLTGQQSLILPCLGRTEVDEQKSGPQFVSVENSMGVVHSSIGNLQPASKHLKSEVAIVCGLAEALSTRIQTRPFPQIPWQSFQDNYDLIRDRISHVIAGFENYNARVREPGGFYLPNSSRSGEFPTSNGMAQFRVHPIPDSQLETGQFLLMTIRSHDQFNTTIYGLNDRYRGVTEGRRVLMMNPEDMKERNFAQSQKVDITSHFYLAESATATRIAKAFYLLAYNIPRGCVAAYYPEANVLVPIESVADGSNTPTYKSIRVSLEASP